MNGKDLRALTLVGPTWDNPVLDPLAVLHLDKRQFLNEPVNQVFVLNRSKVFIILEEAEVKIELIRETFQSEVQEKT